MYASLCCKKAAHEFRFVYGLNDHEILMKLFNHSVAKTQASIPEEIREQLGIFESSIRLSVGLESADDLIHDLEQALKRTYEEKEVESN